MINARATLVQSCNSGKKMQSFGGVEKEKKCEQFLWDVAVFLLFLMLQLV